MSKAAVVVQNLLEQHSANGFFQVDALRLANRWVAAVYSDKPDLFGGKFGQRPHKISVAAVALAHGLDVTGHDSDVQAVAMASLGTIIADICINGRLYPFSSVDHFLLEIADNFYADRLPDLSADAA